ncbi:AP-2 adaptor complex subunit alpha [Purpureocillium lavendulum]|uniref:AP-2 adaptor complex subunit alpha n=1 Tax=Purpureocillium lavendulum TaxID=1247861 RepID=A0AB34FJV3_9HYPO|nr:AP-2 adaptor complex subunit alpha [Purpureocillium lavendulum]
MPLRCNETDIKMAITTAIADLFNSFYELLASIFGAAYAIVHSVVTAVVGFITGIFRLAGDVLGGAIDIAGGVGKFVAGNIVLISVGALLAFAFVRYTAQGQRIAAQKKTN